MIDAPIRTFWRSLPLWLCLLAASLGAYAQNAALPTDGMLLWLKADTLVKANGDPVAVWVDAGGSDRQALFTPMNETDAAPTFVAKAFNGKPAVRFAGNSLLRVNALPLGPFTIAVVFNTTKSGEMLYQHNDGTRAFADGRGGCLLTTGTNATLSVKRHGMQTDKNATGEHADTWAAQAGSPVVAITTFDGTDDSLRLYLNGVPQVLATPTAGGLDSRNVLTQPFDIGARAVSGDMQFHGDLAELVVYDHVLPDTTRQVLNAALWKKYSSVPTFTDPTRVNLLEQWNSNGSYALGCTSTAGDPTNAVNYSAGGAGWIIPNSQNQPNDTTTARFIFPQPVMLGQVMVQWHAADHSPSNYLIRDQNGVIVLDADGPYDDTPRVHTFPPRASQYLEISCNPTSTALNSFECVRLGAYLAKGEVLPLTGTTNILYEEDKKMTVTGSGYDPSWYGHALSTAKPAAAGGNMTLHLSREYELLGALLSNLDSTHYLADARIEISRDGAHWTSVFHKDKYHFRGEPAPRDKGYLTWDAPPGTDLKASWVRLSWGANTDPVAITQFQLFGR